MPTRVRNKYKPNRKGVVAIATGQPMQAALLAVVDKGKAYAEGVVSPRRSGQFASKYETSVGTRGRGNKRRAEGRLKNTTAYAAALEWGTADGKGHAATRPRRPLGMTQAYLRRGG